MADLISLADLKTALNIDPTDDRKDAMYTAVIPAVSSMIRTYTGRDFGAAAATEARNFEYDGSGFLDIDDAATITQVEFVVPNAANIVLTSDQWYAAPPRRDDSPVFSYIVLTSLLGINPYMGFERNMDVLYEEGRLPLVTRTATVTGTWGWATVPQDVKWAAVWTIQEWTSKPSGGENLTSEAIEGYSRSWGRNGAVAASPAIPGRALDILAAYAKVMI